MKTEMVSLLYFITGKRQSINGKEFDTYKVATVANSCSTMHKIHEKEFTLEDFSCEHLTPRFRNQLQNIINELNYLRDKYNHFEDEKGMDMGWGYIFDSKKDIWWQMIQLLPSSYNQTRNVMMNYEVLCNIYKSRKDHKLDEWREFCQWIEELPYSELICGPEFLRKDFNISDEKNDIVDKLCVIGNQNPLTAEEIKKLLGL